MRKLAAILLLGGLTACTPSEVDRWLGWWQDDPQAAEDFAHQEWVQRSLEWGCESYCDVDDPDLIEPEPSAGSEVANSAVGPADTDEPDVAPQPDGDDGGAYWPWDALAQCESGGNWHISTGNGYYGGLQFALGSWQAAGGSGYPHENSVSEQIRVAENLQDMQGWGAWPTCARQVGLL